MFTERWRSIALHLLRVGHTRKTLQRLQRLTCYRGADTDAAYLRVWVVNGLINTVDGANAGINIGQLGKPFIAGLCLENGSQHIYRLLAFTRPDRQVERQQFEMPDACAEGVPEFRLQRAQRHVLAIPRLINIITG